MAYNPIPRIAACTPINESIKYYIVVVDIPIAWNVGNFNNGLLANGVLTYTANVIFPPVDPDPGSQFVTFMLPLWTSQNAPVNTVKVQGSNGQAGIVKTGQVSNSVPVKETPPIDVPIADFSPLQVRPFILFNSSRPAAGISYMVGVFCIPAIETNLNLNAQAFLDPYETEGDIRMTFMFGEPYPPWIVGSSCIGCCLSQPKQFTQVFAEENGESGSPVPLDYTKSISI